MVRGDFNWGRVPLKSPFCEFTICTFQLFGFNNPKTITTHNHSQPTISYNNLATIKSGILTLSRLENHSLLCFLFLLRKNQQQLSQQFFNRKIRNFRPTEIRTRINGLTYHYGFRHYIAIFVVWTMPYGVSYLICAAQPSSLYTFSTIFQQLLNLARHQHGFYSLAFTEFDWFYFCLQSQQKHSIFS